MTTDEKQPLAKIRLGGEEFTIDKLTLGEARRLKREFGMSDLTRFNLADPDQLTGLLTIAYGRTHPDLSPEEVEAHIEALDALDFEDATTDPAAAEDPTVAGATERDGSADAPADGDPATTPATAGSPA